MLVSEARRGFLLGVAAYVMWGGFPLYWPLLEPGGAFELLAHRIVWSVVVMLALVLVMDRRSQFLRILRSPRLSLLLALAGVTISVNWATYIWGVNNHRVVEASLGYFINPLVTVLFGVLILGERLRRMQWVALGVGACAVVVLTVDYGRIPLVAALLAMSFGTYGLLKKTANVGAVESLAFETAVVAPFAGLYIGYLVATGASNFANHGVGHALLYASTGLVTALPLICFGAAATRSSLVTLGLIQYLAPILQFAVGVLVYREDMPPGRWIGFALVWVALALFTYEALSHRRRELQLAAASSTAS